MGEREQAIESQREERGRQHEAQMGARDQQHEERMGERSQQHERVMGQQQARAKIQEVKAKPQPARAASSGSSREKRATGGSVQHHIETPYGTARRAPDGEFYVQHPHTGQYFRIRRRS
jgi:hypothetical protein